MTPVYLDLNRSTFSSLKKQFDDVSGVYLLRCIDGNSYVGATRNLASRAHAHQKVLRGKGTAAWHKRWRKLGSAMASQQPPEDSSQRKLLRKLSYPGKRFDLQKEGGPPTFWWEMFLLEQTPPDPEVLGEREKFWCWALCPSLNSMRASYPKPAKNQGVLY